MNVSPDLNSKNIQRYYTSDFSGGLRLNTDSTKIEDNQYLYSQNLRNRYGRLAPVKLPKLSNLGIPHFGKIQGLYGAGNFLLAIRNGEIYYRNLLDDTGYFRLLSEEFTLSSTVDNIYVELVPASFNNYGRTSTGIDNIDFTSNIGQPSPQSAVVMDGVNQPLLIAPNGQIRQAGTFLSWKLTDREYVPVGILPMYINGRLYIVSPNRKELYHSVTGRPLDFIQAVDNNGNKTEDGAFTVEASRMAHKVDFENITAIGRLNSTDGSFYVSTINNSSLVTPNFNQLFFGEPGFDNAFLFSTGALNEKSIVDINGDTAIIDITGIRNFNAVQQLKFEGRNAYFSNNVSLYFSSLVQTATAATNFDNYALFSVTTIYGPAILVYDTLSNSWVGLDIYSGVGKIKQFAQIKIEGVHKLFFYDDLNNIYEAFASSSTAPWKFYREYSTNNPEMEQKLISVKGIFQNILEKGSITVTDFSDRKIGNSVSQPLDINTVNSATIVPPFGDNTIDRITNRSFRFPLSAQGFKTGILVEGNINLELTSLQVVATASPDNTSTDQKASIYAASSHS